MIIEFSRRLLHYSGKCWTVLRLRPCGLLTSCFCALAISGPTATYAQHAETRSSADQTNSSRDSVEQELIERIHIAKQARLSRLDTATSTISPEVRELCGQLAMVLSSEEFESALSRANKIPAQGELVQTNRNLDIAIEGAGYLRTIDPVTGTFYYTREGKLDITANGQLVIGSAHSGLPLDPPVFIPEETVVIVISPDGAIRARLAGQVELRLLGQISLSQFTDPQRMSRVDVSRFLANEACGTETRSDPGINGAGVIRQALLEDLQIDPLQKLAQLMTTLIELEISSQK